MTHTRRALSAFLVAVASLASVIVGAQSARPGQQPTRDSPAQDAADATPKAHIAGRVIAADSGRPVRRARVFLSGSALPGGRGALTDDEGRFDLTELPEGRYTLTAGKTGFITLSYGQRRPLQAGIPIQLADGQALTSIDFSLPRGSVIAGHVYDESGDPLPGANVRVMRYEYAQGNRQLVPVGSAQTDDLGAYRVWGLNPGDYYVSATTPTFGGGRGLGGFGPPGGFGPAGGFGGRGGRGPQGRGSVAFSAPAGADAEVGYAPTFYPGVPSVNEARAVSVGLSLEVPSIDFSVLLVHTAQVAGIVTNPDGTPTTAGNVTLMPEGSGRLGRGVAGTYVSRIDWDGSFAMAGVAPGRYVLRARSDDTTEPQFALQPVTVTDNDLPDLTVILAPAATISGTVTFQNSQGQQVPDPTQVRIAAPSVDQIDIGPNATARVERDGTFTLGGVQAGQHLLRPQGSPRGWTLKSVLSNGREMIDSPIEVRSGQRLSGVTIVFTDRLSEVNGSITDDRGNPVSEYTLLAFPEDERLWGPQSRHIMTTRPDQNGKYQLRGLPPGDYLLVAVDPAEQGEWFEPSYLGAHRDAGVRFSLGEGDTITRDFKIGAR